MHPTPEATQAPHPETNPGNPVAAVSRWRPTIISAPFGNYIQPQGCTATLGTFTAMARGGRVTQIVKTVRYYPRIKAWVNRIGLRNPGLGWVERKHASQKLDPTDKLISIHGFDEPQWLDLLQRCAKLRPLGVELNMSCPNVGEVSWPDTLFPASARVEQEQGVPVVVKLPPVRYAEMAKAAVDAGLTRFHACNTLPVPAGGLSGAPLKPVALACIADLRKTYGDQIEITAGGGIRAADDVRDFAEAGADTFAVGTKVMTPVYLFRHAGIAGIREAAERAAAS
ncbi:MAG: hypothetical protein AAF916_05090 [Planctomycetota bacterium]